jgi:hypothetical protein
MQASAQEQQGAVLLWLITNTPRREDRLPIKKQRHTRMRDWQRSPVRQPLKLIDPGATPSAGVFLFL